MVAEALSQSALAGSKVSMLAHLGPDIAEPHTASFHEDTASFHEDTASFHEDSPHVDILDS